MTLSNLGYREKGAAVNLNQWMDKSIPYGNLDNFFILANFFLQRIYAGAQALAWFLSILLED